MHTLQCNCKFQIQRTAKQTPLTIVQFMVTVHTVTTDYHAALVSILDTNRLSPLEPNPDPEIPKDADAKFCNSVRINQLKDKRSPKTTAGLEGTSGIMNCSSCVEPEPICISKHPHSGYSMEVNIHTIKNKHQTKSSVPLPNPAQSKWVPRCN